MPLGIEPVVLSLSYVIEVTAPPLSTYAGQHRMVEERLTEGIVKVFPAQERRRMLEIPFNDPSQIISGSGTPHVQIKEALRKAEIVSAVPGPPPIVIMRYYEPGNVDQVVYMYVGPHEHRVIYTFPMLETQTSAPYVISNGSAQGQIKAMVTWAQPIASLIRSDFQERLAILEEGAKIELRKHGGTSK